MIRSDPFELLDIDPEIEKTTHLIRIQTRLQNGESLTIKEESMANLDSNIPPNDDIPTIAIMYMV